MASTSMGRLEPDIEIAALILFDVHLEGMVDGCSGCGLFEEVRTSSTFVVSVTLAFLMAGSSQTAACRSQRNHSLLHTHFQFLLRVMFLQLPQLRCDHPPLHLSVTLDATNGFEGVHAATAAYKPRHVSRGQESTRDNARSAAASRFRLPWDNGKSVELLLVLVVVLCGWLCVDAAAGNNDKSPWW